MTSIFYNRLRNLMIATTASLILLTSCANQPERYQYSENDLFKSSYASSPEAFGSMQSPPDDHLEYAVVSSDIIVYGTVTDDGFVETKVAPGTEILPEKLQLKTTTTSYTLQIEEVWAGEFEDNELTLEIYGDKEHGITKPHKNDHIIAFISTYGNEGNYAPSVGGGCLYVENPPNNQLFAFSSREDYAQYNGKRLSSLKDAIDKRLEKVAAEGTDRLVLGDIGKEYQALYEKNNIS